MSVTHPILMGQVVIDSTNKAIRVTENSVTETLNVAEGTYYVDPNASDADDLLAAVATALATHSEANTYTVTAAWSADTSGGGCTISIAIDTGSNSFAILWANAATTFPAAALGFTEVDTADNTSAKAGTLTPTSVWVSPQPHRSFEPDREHIVWRNESPSGDRRGGQLAGPFYSRTLELALIDSSRAFAAEGGGTPSTPTDATYSGDFATWLSAHSDGTPLLIYFVGPSGLTLASPSGQDAFGGRAWRVDRDSSESFRPQRLSPGLDLYAWSVRLNMVPA